MKVKTAGPNRPWEDPLWDGMCVVRGLPRLLDSDALGRSGLRARNEPDGLHWKSKSPARIDWGGSERMIFVEV